MGVTVYRLHGMVVARVILRCLDHDAYGNHLIRDPETGGFRWVQR